MPRRNQPIKITKTIFANKEDTKRKYLSKQAAERAAELGMLENPQLDLRVYQCPDCHKWHLTSSKSQG